MCHLTIWLWEEGSLLTYEPNNLPASLEYLLLPSLAVIG